MKLKTLLVFCLFLLSTTSFSQKSINSYKYIIVPNIYEFQKSEDQHQINSLLAFLFKKKGFLVIRENEIFPQDLQKNRCLGLTAKVADDSGFFTTKTTINMVDCSNKVILSSSVGKSREKNYKRAYQEAIRDAFNSFSKLNYQYTPLQKEEKTVPKITPTKEEKEIVKTTPIIKKTPNTALPKKSVFKKEELLGNYLFPKWGKGKIMAINDYFSVVTGDENFEIATIHKTSKPNLFIIKWKANKTPFLLEKLPDGNIAIDSNTSTFIVKKI